MITIGTNKNRKILSEERDSICVVCSHLGMQNTVIAKVTIHDRMIRDPIISVWKNRNVVCLRFEFPKKDFINNAATEVMGREIRGNAILLSVTAEEIQHSITNKNNPTTMWSNLAKQLPPVVPLDDMAKERKLQEASDKREAWQEYYRRKARNRLAEKSTDELEADEAALTTDADMDQWLVEEEFANSLDV